MAPNRKLIGFDPATLQALELLSRDSGKDLQALADEAFADLLAKHHRPRTLKDAQDASQPMRSSAKATRFLTAQSTCPPNRRQQGVNLIVDGIVLEALLNAIESGGGGGVAPSLVLTTRISR